MRALQGLCAGRRVLFVNAIRSDTRSGGETVTRLVRQAVAAAAESRSLEFVPASRGASSRWSRLAFVLESFPGPLFVLLHRRLHWTSLEFFSRLSPLLALRCLWARLAFRPQQVIFNHHATFLYARLFAGADIAFIWHDVPSLKSGDGGTGRGDARCCAVIESWMKAPSSRAFTFSHGEARFLRRYHGVGATLLPAVGTRRFDVRLPRRAGRLLLVGNWSRDENCDGAGAFFARLLAGGRHMEGPDRLPSFTLAGAHAAAFLRRLRCRLPAIGAADIEAVEGFGDLSEFDACALVAPIARGAGIKIKTLEAWAADLPVVGTAQAYSGLPASVWRLGGKRFESIDALAAFCLHDDAMAEELSRLRPAEAFDRYLALSGEGAAAQ